MFHQPYRMIVVSFTASIILLAGLLIYRFVFPKKIITLFVLLLLVSLLPIISIARQGTYESGVLSENIQITRSFYDNLTEGNIIPVWGADYFGGYGDPQHAYIYPLAYYFSSFFHFLGFSYLDSVKLVLAFTFVFSGITMFLWMKDEFGEIPGFVAALFYTFAPYHLIETHFRATLGVTTAFAFIPLVFFFIHKTLMQPKVLSVFLGGVSFGLLILS